MTYNQCIYWQCDIQRCVSVLDISLYFRNLQAYVFHLLDMFKSVTSVYVACLLHRVDFLKCNLFWRNLYRAVCPSPCQKFVTRCRSSRREKKELTFYFYSFRPEFQRNQFSCQVCCSKLPHLQGMSLESILHCY